MRVAAGPIDELPTDRCLPLADGAVLLMMTDDGPRAYANRCLHLGSAMDEAWIRDGVLSCPLHFWRYHASTGQLIGSSPQDRPGLTTFDVDVVDGQVFVEVPEPPKQLSFRERQLKHAAEWNRDR